MRAISLCLPLLLMALPAVPVLAAENAMSVEAQLCRNQLDLLTRGGKLTESEIAHFTAQCDCLEDKARSDGAATSPSSCAEDRNS
jgi:hypothetical protein